MRAFCLSPFLAALSFIIARGNTGLITDIIKNDK